MRKYRFFAQVNNVWMKFTGIYSEGYIHTSNQSFDIKKTKGRKIISQTISTDDLFQ